MEKAKVLGVKVATKETEYFAVLPVLCLEYQNIGYYCRNTKYGENGWKKDPVSLGQLFEDFSGLNKVL